METVKLNGNSFIEANRTQRSAEAERPSLGDATTQIADNALQHRESDTIKVSDRAEDVRRFAARIEEIPDVRSERVEPLRNQVQANQYHPTSDAIADAIVKSESDSRVTFN